MALGFAESLRYVNLSFGMRVFRTFRHVFHCFYRAAWNADAV